MNLLGQRNQYRLCISDGLPEPEPGSQGNALNHLHGSVAQVDRHQAKPSGLHQQSAALIACSTLPPQRTHKTCDKRTPAAAALTGSKAFSASINAQNSSPEEAVASSE